MLLAIYALATLALEQKCERDSISHLQVLLARAATSRQCDRTELAHQFEKLIELAEVRHWPRLQHCLIPLLRAICAESEAIADSLESLQRAGAESLLQLRATLRQQSDPGQVSGRCLPLGEYCDNLLQRLACEEQLIPLAQRVFCSEEWFRVGREFLRQDASQTVHRA